MNAVASLPENARLSTPVLFIIFNRPDTTQQVFARIREQKPARLFIAADGPRKNHPTDNETCAAARSIRDQIDWPCDVSTFYREENLGCRRAVSGAINWFFEHVEDGIILEDDCLPHPQFFTYCAQLLDHYRDDHKVMHISGDNFQFGRSRGDGSYYFSRIAHIWGWVTWRRAWKSYDVDMKDFPEFSQKRPPFFIDNKLEAYWMFHFGRMARGADTWDYQWTYAVMKQQGYCIMPNVNLISNIGFGAVATHATDASDPVAHLPTHPILPLIHPRSITFDDAADRFTVEEAFPIPPLYKRVVAKMKKILKSITS